MGIIAWVAFGLIAGIIAKWLMPGRDPGGFFITIGIGVAGAFLGGFVGSLIGIGDVTGFNLKSMGLAIVGAVALLFVYRTLRP